jgi:hypothetical protein
VKNEALKKISENDQAREFTQEKDKILKSSYRIKMMSDNLYLWSAQGMYPHQIP